MLINVLTKDETPVATLRRIRSGSVTVTANERHEGQFVFPSTLPELRATPLRKGMLVEQKVLKRLFVFLLQEKVIREGSYLPQHHHQQEEYLC